jgi:fructokinase
MSCNVLAVGEVVWDIIRGQEYIGGAPFNLAAHLARLGGKAHILTRVGTDPRGRRAVREMRRLGVESTLVQTDPEHPTGWARVTVGVNGASTFTLPKDPAYLHIEMNDPTLRYVLAARLDVISFGTLQQRGKVTRRTLRELLQRVRVREVFYDVNVRMGYYPEEVLRQSLQLSTIVKFNEDEVSMVSRRLYGRKLAEKKLVRKLTQEFPLRVLCVTKGARGCSVHAFGESRSFGSESVQVADTVGAGDAFSAAFLRHYCRVRDPFEAARRGNLLGAYVASRPGAVPEYDDRIRHALEI